MHTPRMRPPPPFVLSPDELTKKIKEWAKPKPLYTLDKLHATHALRFDWTGWLSEDAQFPASTPTVVRGLAPLWQQDGLRLEQHKPRGNTLQILCRTEPHVSPTLFAKCVKGRLQHAFRQAGTPVKFSRKVAVRTLGENVSAAVAGYLGKQVRKEGFVDPRYVKRLQDFTVIRDDVDLSQPAASHSGRYWYNLHLVLVVGDRCRIQDYAMLGKMRDGTFQIAQAKGYAVKSVAVMPDHLHVALRGNISHSPADTAFAFLNNLAYMLGRFRIWQNHYYAGTFSEYGLDVIRKISRQSSSPAAQGRRGRC